MDLVTLNSTQQEQKLVENYDSLIWAERFNTIGDFQLQTGNIEKFMELLPEGKIVSLRESNVPMIVETHQIIRKKNTPQNLIIKGRSFESILDRRLSVEAVTAGTNEWNLVAKIPSDVAYYIIYQICVLGIAAIEDIFPPDLAQFITPADFLNTEGPNKSFTIPRGNLLSTVLTFLQTQYPAEGSSPEVVPHGIRGVRPNNTGTAIGIEIYTGIDRSDKVYFDGTRDLLDDGSYLFSKVASANTAYILGSNTAVKLNGSVGAKSGMERRVILVDGTSAGNIGAEALVEQGKTSLSEAKVIALFDGSINQDLSPYTYGKDYFLGDTVKLVGDYGLTQPARITEYIRSEDSTGTKSYPTLTTLDS